MAILKGFKKTGISVQIMCEKMDEGDILFSKEIDILESDTTGSLMDKLAILSSDLLKEKLVDYIEGKIFPTKQDSTQATYCYLSDVSYEKAKINWDKSASEIHNLVRAFNPDPIAYTESLHTNISGKVRIYETKVSDVSLSSEIGKIEIKNNLALVRCGSGTIQLLKLQLEGKNIISAQDLINSLKSR
jgi:methionyl-tRNA formyltransferase